MEPTKIKEKKYCLYCKKELEDSPMYSKRKYCNSLCAGLWYYHNSPRVNHRVKVNSLNSYNNRKDNQEYKSKARSKWNEWIKTNREHYNTYMRNYMRNYNQKKRERDVDSVEKKPENKIQRLFRRRFK